MVPSDTISLLFKYGVQTIVVYLLFRYLPKTQISNSDLVSMIGILLFTYILFDLANRNSAQMEHFEQESKQKPCVCPTVPKGVTDEIEEIDTMLMEEEPQSKQMAEEEQHRQSKQLSEEEQRRAMANDKAAQAQMNQLMAEEELAQEELNKLVKEEEKLTNVSYKKGYQDAMKALQTRTNNVPPSDSMTKVSEQSSAPSQGQPMALSNIPGTSRTADPDAEFDSTRRQYRNDEANRDNLNQGQFQRIEADRKHTNGEEYQRRRGGRDGVNWDDDQETEMRFTDYDPDMHKSLGELNYYDYGYSFMPPSKWWSPRARPPVCITEKQCSVCPMTTQGTPVNVKEWDSSRFVTNGPPINTKYFDEYWNRRQDRR